MDNVKIENIILEKKMEAYGSNKDDFVAPGEFTVTISLAEYRSLVSSNATRNEAIKKAEDDKYDRNQENKDLKRQIEEAGLLADPDGTGYFTIATRQAMLSVETPLVITEDNVRAEGDVYLEWVDHEVGHDENGDPLEF